MGPKHKNLSFVFLTPSITITQVRRLLDWKKINCCNLWRSRMKNFRRKTYQPHSQRTPYNFKIIISMLSMITLMRIKYKITNIRLQGRWELHFRLCTYNQTILYAFCSTRTEKYVRCGSRATWSIFVTSNPVSCQSTIVTHGLTD
jgi:hypothetical protein